MTNSKANQLSWLPNFDIEHTSPDCTCFGKSCTDCHKPLCKDKFRNGNSFCEPCRYKRIVVRYREREYGISENDFRHILKLQDGKCAICGTPESNHIDHNHTTNKVRAILCNGCNLALGYCHEDKNIMRQSIRYLSKHEGYGNYELDVLAEDLQ